MSENEIKSLYDSLIKSGDLLDVYPDMTGEWEQDRKKFEREYETNERMLDFNLDEEFFESDEEDLLP